MHWAPGIPRALFSKGDKFRQASGADCAAGMLDGYAGLLEGVGLEPRVALAAGGGLAGMRERVQQLGGQLYVNRLIQDTTPTGFSLEILVPHDGGGSRD
mgnify:CR=1 FL=1